MSIKDLLNEIKRGNSKILRANNKKLEPKDVELKEELYIGNLHHVSRHHHNNHCWTMFISKSPTDVEPPLTVQSVTYHLHPTFRPSAVTVEEPPFYLDRRGWGYFTVEADIVLKPEFYPSPNAKDNDTEDQTTDSKEEESAMPIAEMTNPKFWKKSKKKKNNRKDRIVIRAAHSIHFGSPITTHHIQTNLPYIVDSPSLQELIIEQTNQRSINNLKRRRRALRKRNRAREAASNDVLNSNAANDNAPDDEDLSDIEDKDEITKQYIPEISLKGFSLSRPKLLEILSECLGKSTPEDVLEIIVEYASIYCVDGLPNELCKTRVVIEQCNHVELVIMKPILELVIKECDTCNIQMLNVEFMVRSYQSKMLRLALKGDSGCTSYRFERCENIDIHALDTQKRMIFMSLFSQNLSVKMFNPYFPNDASKCVAQFPRAQHHDDDDGDEVDVDRGWDDDEEEQEPQDAKDNDDDDDGATGGGGVIHGWKKWFMEANKECYLTVFRKDRDVATFGRPTPFSLQKGTSLIPLLD